MPYTYRFFSQCKYLIIKQIKQYQSVGIMSLIVLLSEGWYKLVVNIHNILKISLMCIL